MPKLPAASSSRPSSRAASATSLTIPPPLPVPWTTGEVLLTAGPEFSDDVCPLLLEGLNDVNQKRPPLATEYLIPMFLSRWSFVRSRCHSLRQGPIPGCVTRPVLPKLLLPPRIRPRVSSVVGLRFPCDLIDLFLHSGDLGVKGVDSTFLLVPLFSRQHVVLPAAIGHDMPVRLQTVQRFNSPRKGPVVICHGKVEMSPSGAK